MTTFAFYRHYQAARFRGRFHIIRVTNRLGRGYSFEALRAKMLFTESGRF
jgi:hypothetical protein